MRKISEVKPLLFEGYLVICLSSDWIIVFDQKIPTFLVYIDDNDKLHFVSHEEIKNEL